MKKTLFFIILVFSLLFCGQALAAEYQPMPQMDVTQYATTPSLTINDNDVSEKYVITKDGVTYVPVELFASFKNTLAYNQVDGQPVALIQRWYDNGSPATIIIFVTVQHPGETKPFFWATDGTVWISLRENAGKIGAEVTYDPDANAITVRN